MSDNKCGAKCCLTGVFRAPVKCEYCIGEFLDMASLLEHENKHDVPPKHDENGNVIFTLKAYNYNILSIDYCFKD